MEAAVTKISTKGQIVIPSGVRRRLRIKDGDTLLMLAADDSIILKKVSAKTFEQLARPIWQKARELGLSEREVDEIIKEAKVSSRPR